MTATLAQIEINIDLDAAAFDVDVPPGAAPLSLDELRAGRAAGREAVSGR